MDYIPWIPRSHTVCMDGTKLSIQAGENLYCHPRNNEGPWTAVEVGFIQDKDGNQITPPQEWEEYADCSFPSDIYAYVPFELVEAFIASHGGRMWHV